MRTLLIASLLTATPAFIYAQATFDVATIKPQPAQQIGHSHSRTSTDTATGRLNYTTVTLKDIVGQAYQVPLFQIAGPNWMDVDRFDIAATFPAKTDAKQIPLMLQALLTERFGLKMHPETREEPVYALEIAKGGSKMVAAKSSTGSSSNANGGNIHFTAQVPMMQFAEFLSPRMDRPVLDRTGLIGPFQIKLDWSPDENQDKPGREIGPSIFTALQEQLGLRLRATKGPVQTLVVDYADRNPSEN